jgi:hypothetical protein
LQPRRSSCAGHDLAQHDFLPLRRVILSRDSRHAKPQAAPVTLLLRVHPDQEQIADFPSPREPRLVRVLEARDQSNLCDQTVRLEDASTVTIARTMHTRASVAVAIYAGGFSTFSSNPPSFRTRKHPNCRPHSRRRQ